MTRRESVPPLRSMLCTVGCQTTSPTRLWWATKSTTGSSRFLNSPPSGICQILTVQSSEPLAMMSSSCGHHWMSRTAARWPTTSGQSRSTRPVCQRQTSSVLLTSLFQTNYAWKEESRKTTHRVGWRHWRLVQRTGGEHWPSTTLPRNNLPLKMAANSLR